MTQKRERIIANVLTGFLGAGKTSLLNRLLATPELGDTAVIINEFGSIGLDHLLVEAVDDDIVLLKSGCICCTIRGDLKDAVLSLFERRQKGTIKPFARLVIETTGLADPAPIIATLSADLMLKYHFTMGNVVTVVDVPNGRRNIDTYIESARQVAVADRIVVTKADLETVANRTALVATLAAINPAADIVLCDAATDVQSLLLTDDIHGVFGRSATAPRWMAAAHEHGMAVPDVNRHGSILAISITCERPIEWSRFSLWLSMLIHRHGSRILRLKGILDVEGAASPLVIHGVQHLIHKPFHLADWSTMPRRTSLVLITEGELGDLQRSFRLFIER